MLKTKSFLEQVIAAKQTSLEVNPDRIEQLKIAFKREILDVESKLILLQQSYNKTVVRESSTPADIITVYREYALTELYLKSVKEQYDILFPEVSVTVNADTNETTKV